MHHACTIDRSADDDRDGAVNGSDGSGDGACDGGSFLCAIADAGTPRQLPPLVYAEHFKSARDIHFPS